MRIRNNKRHLVSNKEYSRLPYWTDEGYDDVQRQTSQKYVQDNYGKFAESENQPPYLNDSEYDNGYQGLEYQYQNPEYFDPTDLPDVDFTDTVPKGTCYELWTSIFGHGTGTFIPSSSQWAAIKEYEKLCPVIYVPHICCLGMKISGPTTLTPGEEAYYSVSGGAAGCAYEMKASGGTFVGTKYFAPMTPGTYELYVTPEMSNDRGDKCATLYVTVESLCTGTIGYTSLQMQISTSQTLTVTGSSGGTYSWATTSGSIVPTEGTSVTFTATATNANCSSNPTITLTCGGAVVDTIAIAVNAYSSDVNAYSKGVPLNKFNCWYTPGMCRWICAAAETAYYNCSGTLRYSGAPKFSCGAGGGTGTGWYSCDGYPGVDCCSSGTSWCGEKKAQYCTTCSTAAEAAANLPLTDLRTENQKANGCCPAQLL